MHRLGLLLLLMTGCAQILGLDDPAGRDGGGPGDPVDADVPDANLPDAAIPCNDGACPPGLTCDLDTFERVCRPIGTAVAGALCDRAEDCAAGLTCHMGVCRTVCTSAADCDDTVEGACTIASYAGAYVCDTVCDVLSAGTSCGEDRYCRPERTDVGYTTFCAGRDRAGDRGQDLPCGPSDCQPGFECAEFVFPGYRCMAWCDLDRPVCASGTTCESAYGNGDVVIRGKRYGLCKSPRPSSLGPRYPTTM